MSDFKPVELVHKDGRRFTATSPRELNDLLVSGKYRVAAKPAEPAKPVDEKKPEPPKSVAGK